MRDVAKPLPKAGEASVKLHASTVSM